MWALLPVLFLLQSFAGPAKPDPAPETLVITNVSVVDVRTGTTTPNLTLVIHHGRIQAVAKIGMIGSNHQTKVVNANGKYLIPGLWDMHVHSAGARAARWEANSILSLYIANGITGIRDMGDEFSTVEARQRAIEQGRLLGPHMVIARPLFAPDNSADSLSVPTPAEGRRAVDKLKQKGADFIKILSGMPREVYFAIAQEAEKQKLPFVGQVPDSVSAEEASAAGQRSIEHLSGVMVGCSDKPPHSPRERFADGDQNDDELRQAASIEVPAGCDPDAAWKLFTQFADHATWQVPTLVWWRASAQLRNPNVDSAGELRYVPASLRRRWEQDKLPPALVDESASLHQPLVRAREITNLMRRAGVLMMAGSDSPAPYDIPGFSLHDELELLVESGFTPAEALRSATLNPALFLAKLNDYGVVERSRVADLVLLEDNPLNDIRNSRKIAAVIVGGRYYARPVLDRMLEGMEAAAKLQ